MNSLRNSSSGLLADFLATSHSSFVSVLPSMLPRLTHLSLKKSIQNPQKRVLQ